MWHEARRQEKQLRARIVDGSKRAERRRRYFDNVRRDPDQFMQIHGNKSVIYAERSIARAAEDANILRPWVGDKEILIDRFDARSHLDCIETPEGEPQLSSMEKKEELVCNYERYRLLVMNEFKDISEKAVLKNISEKEFWLNGQTEDQRKVELEKKKRKTGEKKATIGFSYGDSTTVAGRNEQESESEDEMQTEELGADLEVYLLNPESQKRCNKIGENFGVADQNFCALFKADQQAQRTASELKRIDRQKASLIGRDAKDDRKLLKQERAILIANARQDESIIVFPSERATEEKAVSESSSSSSDEESAKAEFILSFGKDDEEPLKKLSSRRRKNDRNRRRSRSRSRSRDRRRSATGSRERYRRRRSYSRDTRSKSRERRRSRDRGKRSRDKKRSVRSRSRSTDRKRRRARTSSSRSQSPDRPIFKNNPVEKTKFQEVLAEKRESSDDNGPTNLLDIRSSMSESEKERIEIENRKRRVRKTKRMLKSKPGSRREHTSEKDNSEHVQAVKKKMQKALKATVEELKEEEEERKRETERERRVRDELIFIEQQERKMREQKKVEDLRRADLERAIEDARKRAEVQRRRRHSSDSDDGD